MHGDPQSTWFDSPDSRDANARFRLLSQLGAGAHGVVFEALDRARNTRVALKSLHHESPQSILRFKHEFRTLVQLHHPNLVEFGELFEHEGRWCFTMQLVEGVDLLRHVRHARPDDDADHTLTQRAGAPLGCDVTRLRHALVQLGSGLQALHEAGKIHRDVKPSNIRVRPDGSLVLLDFGLITTSLHTSLSQADRVVGTVAYMAPEQAGARTLSPAADCYAVGVLTYQALTGELPFAGSALQVLTLKQSDAVRFCPEYAAFLPPDLVELCQDLCSIDPLLRPTAAELTARAGGTSHAAHSRTRTDVSVPSPLPELQPPADPCFGRERELELLETGLARALAGELTKVQIHGAPGVGKSALLRAFRARLAQQRPDCLVLTGSCHEQERVAYKAFDSAIDELGSYLEKLTHEECGRLVPQHVHALASVFPVLGRLAALAVDGGDSSSPDPITLRSKAYAALRDLLHRTAERLPLVLMLDDLHWSDAESLELLWALTRPPHPPPLLLVAALRPLHEHATELHAGVTRALAGRDTIALELATLPGPAAQALAQHLLCALPEKPAGVSAESVASVAAGHPLFIELLVRAAAQGHSDISALDQALWLEVAALTPDARELLQLLAVAGKSTAEHALADAAGLTPHDFARALSELRRRRFVCVYEREGVLAVAPYHAHFSAVLLAHATPTELQQRHLALAQALSQGACRDPEALARHWQASGRQDAAATCFVQAAVVAERARAFGHAAALYRSALASQPQRTAAERSPWLHKLGEMLVNAGRSAEAAHAFLEAAAAEPPAQSRALLHLAAAHFLRAGNTEQGLAVARRLFAEIGESLPLSPAGALVALSWQRTQIRMRGLEVRERAQAEVSSDQRFACDALWSIAMPLSTLDLVRGFELHSRCLLRALQLGDPARIARSLAMESLYRDTLTADQELRVRGMLATAENLARRTGDRYLIAVTQLCRASQHLMYGEPALALPAADAAARMFEDECHNVSWEIGGARTTALTALSFLGRFDELEPRYRAAAEEAEQRGNLHSFTTLVTLTRCAIDLVSDNTEACRAYLQEAVRPCPPERFLQYAFTLGANVLLDLYAGGPAAHSRIEAGWPQLRRQLILKAGRFRVFFVFTRGVAALASLADDQRDAQARLRLVRACAAQLARERAGDSVAGARLLRGQHAALCGEHEAAITHYRAAAELWERNEMYGARIANYRLGELLGGSEGAGLIAKTQQWASAQGIKRLDRFLAVCAPVSGVRALRA
jgi:eukaryotic-like serine/threonine-protein kinase